MPASRPVPRRALAGLAGVVGLALATAGCATGGTTTAPTTNSVAATTVPPPGAPQLQSIVVTAGDLPAGWTARPAVPPADRVAAAAAFAQCMGVSNTQGDVVAVAYSPEFASGQVVIASDAVSFANRADVPADTAALLDPKAASCFVGVGKSQLAAGLPKGATLKSDTLKITPGAAGGPPNVVATATATVTYTVAGRSVNLNDDIVYLVAPRIEARIDFYNVGKPVDPKVKAAVVTKVAQRVAFGS